MRSCHANGCLSRVCKCPYMDVAALCHPFITQSIFICRPQVLPKGVQREQEMADIFGGRVFKT